MPNCIICLMTARRISVPAISYSVPISMKLTGLFLGDSSSCRIRISTSFQRKYSSGLFFIFEYFVSRCRFSLFGFVLSAAKMARHETHRGSYSLLIITLVDRKDKHDSSHLIDFDMQLQLAFTAGLSSVWSCYTRYIRYEPNRLMLSIGLRRVYINVIITILDIGHRAVFYVKRNV
jgi:hypothetical protein